MSLVIDQERSKRIAATVRVERARQGIKRESELAAQLGMSHSSLRRRLRGEVEWGYGHLEILGRIFGMSVDEIVGDRAA